MIQTASLCLHLMMASIRGQMQYRVSFTIGVLSGMLFQGLGIVMIWAILETFTSLGDWQFGEIALLYGLRLTAHGVYLLFFSSMYSIDDMVREGDWDRPQVRPLHPLLQLMFGRIRIAVIGDLVGGIAILMAALSMVKIDWNIGIVLLLGGAIIGGAMIDGAFQILPASLTFKYIESWPARVISDDIFSRYGNYPIDIFGNIAARILTFVIPLAFVAWLPVATMLDKPTFLPSWTGWLSLPTGIVVFTTAVVTFVKSSRHYQSSGH